MAQPDNRKLHALRRHIDDLLAGGATILARDPLTLLCEGQTLKVRHGMLVGYSGLLDMVGPITDHEWPEALRQMAADLCVKQLDEAIRQLQRTPTPVDLGSSANDS